MSLRNLIRDYESNLTSSVTIRGAQSPYTDDFAQAVLLHKLSKHRQSGNVRSMAIYLAKWIKEDLGPLSDRAKGLAREAGLIYDSYKGVGYSHSDGTYHWFSI